MSKLSFQGFAETGFESPPWYLASGSAPFQLFYRILVNGRIFQLTPMGVNNFIKLLISVCHNTESSDISVFIILN